MCLQSDFVVSFLVDAGHGNVQFYGMEYFSTPNALFQTTKCCSQNSSIQGVVEGFQGFRHPQSLNFGPKSICHSLKQHLAKTFQQFQ